VVLRVIDPGSSAHSTWKAGAKGMEEAREEAEGVLEGVMKRNGEEKQVSWHIEPSASEIRGGRQAPKVD
jgi:hypothetical protein